MRRLMIIVMMLLIRFEIIQSIAVYLMTFKLYLHSSLLEQQFLRNTDIPGPYLGGDQRMNQIQKKKCGRVLQNAGKKKTKDE